GVFIDYDDVTLFFSSKGRKGMGGYDVFKSTFDPVKNEWSEPVNLGYPINTPDDDIYFVTTKDGKRAYYSSVREDGMGYTDIYMITIPDGLKNDDAIAAKPPVVPKEETPADTVKTTPVQIASNETKPTETKPTETNTPTTPEKTNTTVENKTRSAAQPLKFRISVVDARSEEHTSELQSREKHVCRLLLENTNLRIWTVTSPASPLSTTPS